MKLINNITTTVSLDEDEKQILAQAHLIINELYSKMVNNKFHFLLTKEDSFVISIGEINSMSEILSTLSNYGELTTTYKSNEEEI